MQRDVEVAVIGAGAAGVAAAAQIRATGRLSVAVLEARGRVGGRAWTMRNAGLPLDLGCGWLHSADQNEWAALASKLGFAIDSSPPPWGTQANDIGFSPADQAEFHLARECFWERLDKAGDVEPDRPASELLDSGCDQYLHQWRRSRSALGSRLVPVQ